MKKIILKASLITVGALIAAGILFFSLWILISPQSMATVSEKLGNYNFAVTCANLKFKYSDDTEDLARCVEDSILAKDDKKIVKYGEQLIARDDFDSLCAKRDSELAVSDGEQGAKNNYKTYILSTVAVSQYREGNLEKAVATAENGGTIACFRKLVIEVVSSNKQSDIEKVQDIKDPDLKAEVSAFIDELING